MAFLHSRNVCHRDLKSANVLLTKECVPQICDFGLAKWMEFSNRTTSAHGTVLWTAPELLLGRECTSKADVFSFAVVMYEIFVRHLPYESPHIATPVVIAQVAAGRLRPAIPGDMDKSVSNLLTRCWNQDPDRRPSFTELLKKLDKAYEACRTSGRISPFAKDRRRPSVVGSVGGGSYSETEAKVMDLVLGVCDNEVVVVGDDDDDGDNNNNNNKEEILLMEPLLKPRGVV